MPTLFKRLIEPLGLNVDFTDPYWNISRAAACGWLGAAMAADLLAQWLVGRPTWWTLGASAMTIALFWALPPRLAGAVGGLYIGQALVSILVAYAAATAGSAVLVATAAYLWSAWCLFALVRLGLNYLRTPKARF
jgi:hypothetical protein